jgi:UDP-GlcNAc:undecaprenyl-phosphate GlcNAc-1-phosphate transferase
LDPLHAISIAAVSAAVSAAATPLMMRLAWLLGVVDRPNERKVSKRASMPLLGGLAVALGLLGGVAAVGLLLGLDGMGESLAGFLAGAVVLVAAGVWDDRYEKLGFQVLAAVIAVQTSFRFDLFSSPLTGDTFPVPTWIMWPISLLWIVGVTNALNLIDGLDGLSSGVGAIIAGTLTVICWEAGQWTGVVIGLALFGALLGYLPFNFPPARIFLGDTGSMLIGFTLSLIALEGYRKLALLAFLVPLIALAIPILDTLLSILRRLRSGRGVFTADRLHMHHRLLHREGSHRGAVLMLYFLTACFCMIALSFARVEGWIAYLYLVAVVAVTVRLLRNLDAFSLEVDSTDEAEVVAAGLTVKLEE